MFTRRCQRLQIYAHVKANPHIVSLSRRNTTLRLHAQTKTLKPQTRSSVTLASTRARLALVALRVPWSARTCDHRGTCYRTPPGPRGGYHHPAHAGCATPRDRCPTIPQPSGDRRGCTRRTPTTRQKHTTIMFTSVFAFTTSHTTSHPIVTRASSSSHLFTLFAPATDRSTTGRT